MSAMWDVDWDADEPKLPPLAFERWLNAWVPEFAEEHPAPPLADYVDPAMHGNWTPETGLAEATRRIEIAGARGDDWLDLGGLQLHEWPEALFDLRGLKCLYLGRDAEARSPAYAGYRYAEERCNALPAPPRAFLDACAQLDALDLDGSSIGDAGARALAALTGLRSLDLGRNRIGDDGARAISALTGLRSLDLGLNRIGPDGARGLADLTGLRGLDLFLNVIGADGARALADLTSLHSLDLGQNRIGDDGARALAALTGLRSLNLYRNRIGADGARALAALAGLRTFHLGFNKIGADGARALAALTGLQSLHLRFNKIGDDGAWALAPLTGLRSLGLDDNGIGDDGARALAALTGLRSLTLARNKIGDEGTRALAALTGLRNLQLRDNNVGPIDLSVFSGLERISIDADLSPTLPAWWLRRELREAYVAGSTLGGAPRELLSGQSYNDLLPALRAYLRDGATNFSGGLPILPEIWANALIPIRDVKLMLLGNGTVGKTQIKNRLARLPFEAGSASTHGVSLTTVPLRPPAQRSWLSRLFFDAPEEDGPILKIWDFGGQDMYLGTHALFLRSRAVFAAVWAVGRERGINDADRYQSKNFPYEYWLRYIEANAGTDQPLLMVRTRADEAEWADPPPAPPALLARFAKRREMIHYSAPPSPGAPPDAPPQRGHDDLLRQLEAACEAALEDAGSVPESWSKLAERLEARRARSAAAIDAGQPPAREDLRIDQDEYRALCAEVVQADGLISNPTETLRYLHEVGQVFWKPDLLGGWIVVNQQWALDAIYTVFDRKDGAFARIRDAQRGRFTRAHLAESVWADQPEAAQRVFLEMMVDCGVAFVLEREATSGETTYVAPELLPEKADFAIPPDRIDPTRPMVETERRHGFLSPTLIRSVMAEVGAKAGLAADYWRDGFYLEDEATGAAATVEAIGSPTEDAPYAGVIRIRAQRGDASALAATLRAVVEEIEARLHLEGDAWTGDDGEGRTGAPRSYDPDGDRSERSAMDQITPGLIRLRKPEAYVSYAWGDLTDGADREDRKREEALLGLVDRAAQWGVTLRYDKARMSQGDLISEFIDKIADADRVFVILSDKYCRSIYCMTEMLKIYERAGSKRRLKDQIRLLRLPSAEIKRPDYRFGLAEEWGQRFDALRGRVFGETGQVIMGTDTFDELRMLQTLHIDSETVLKILQDVNAPRDVADIDEDAFFGDLADWPEARALRPAA